MSVPDATAGSPDRSGGTGPLVDGLLLCDKPAGISSHDLVLQVRRAFGKGVKVGHAGTLDPFATGLLVMLVGRATKIQDRVMHQPKQYLVTARFGAVSSTGDTEGEITETGIVPDAELALPVGNIRQRPPAHSAVKIRGKRAYKLARAGIAVEMPEREVTVFRFEETARRPETHERDYVIECSSGTYVRSLIADLGDAYCTTLRRTRIGPFDVADACTELDPARLLPLTEALTLVGER